MEPVQETNEASEMTNEISEANVAQAAEIES